MEELWKSIDGSRGVYSISNYGNIRSRSNGRWTSTKLSSVPRLLTPQTTNQGYLSVGLSLRGVIKRYLVHRLVAESFVPNPDELGVVHHLDGNKKNNRSDNLVWTSKRINTREYFKTVRNLPVNVGYDRRALLRGKPYYVRVKYKGQQVMAGSYSTVEQAEKVAHKIQVELDSGVFNPEKYKLKRKLPRWVYHRPECSANPYRVARTVKTKLINYGQFPTLEEACSVARQLELSEEKGVE